MNENWRNLIGFAHDSGTPDPVAAWTATRLHGSAVNLRRKPLNPITRRDVFRVPAAAAVPFSEHVLRWDWPLTSNLSPIILLCDGMSDAGRAEAITGGYRWRIGRGAVPVGYNAILDTVDGLHHEGSGIFTDWTITAERASEIQCQTTMALRSLTDDDSATALAAAPSSGRLATSSAAAASIGGGTDPVMSIVLGIQREAKAAGFTEDGVAAAWEGPIVPDIAGRIVCRCPAASYDAALRDQLEASLTITFTLPGGATLAFTMPNCIFQATARAVVNRTSYEYALEFAAVQDGSDDAATIELVTL